MSAPSILELAQEYPQLAAYIARVWVEATGLTWEHEFDKAQRGLYASYRAIRKTLQKELGIRAIKQRWRRSH